MLVKTKFLQYKERYKLYKTNAKIAVIVIVESAESLHILEKYLENIEDSCVVCFLLSQALKIELEKFQRIIKYSTRLFIHKDGESYYRAFFSMLEVLQKEDISFFPVLEFKKNMSEEFSKVIYSPLFSSKVTVENILEELDTTCLKLIGVADIYTSMKKHLDKQEHFISKFLLKMGEKNLFEDRGIFSENVFWMHKDLVLLLLAHKDFFMSINEDECFNDLSSLSFFCEVLLEKNGMNFGLVYSTDYNRKDYKILPLEENTRYHHFSTSTILNHQRNLEVNHKIIEENKFFDSDYYEIEIFSDSSLEMDAKLHYLRYGVFRNYAINTTSSPFQCISMYGDFFENGFDSLDGIGEEIKDKELIEMSNLFDEVYYTRSNPKVKNTTLDGLTHYVTTGWKEDKNPSAEFDAIWYRSEYLQDFLIPMNALVHYILIGETKGYLKRPKYINQEKKYSVNFSKEPKRITLFAGYDLEGIIDETVIYFLEELSKYSDVYYCCDYDLEKKELKKIEHCVKNAWGVRHGEYDFGSYKMLAKYLVGWENIKKYDEVLLVNDSSYLLKPLDEVFAKMDKKKCSWWGMQATKGTFPRKNVPSNKLIHKIPMETIKKDYLMKYEEDDIYDFHVGSYFLAFRKPILEAGLLENILNNVSKEYNKTNIILKYEVGTTRKLINLGYEFDTYMDDLYPLHPVFTENVFEMIDNGFPFFKRFLLAVNHYHVKDLWQWEEKILKAIPDADIECMKNNLTRLVSQSTLDKTLHYK